MAEDTDGIWNGDDKDEWEGGNGGILPTGRMDNRRTSIVGTRVVAGTATNNGGGMYVSCDRRENSVGGGGTSSGSFTLACQDIVIRKVTVEHCEAGKNGGGIYIERTVVVLDDVKVLSNMAMKSGGGLALVGNCGVAAVATTVLSNTARVSGGGVLIMDGTTSIVGGGIQLKHGIYGNQWNNKEVGYEGREFFSGWMPLTDGDWRETLDNQDLAGRLQISKNSVMDVFGNMTGIGGGMHLRNAFLSAGQMVVSENVAENGGGVSFMCAVWLWSV